MRPYPVEKDSIALGHWLGDLGFPAEEEREQLRHVIHIGPSSSFIDLPPPFPAPGTLIPVTAMFELILGRFS
jgi:hypothetical protein